jgi:hypothetical protein
MGVHQGDFIMFKHVMQKLFNFEYFHQWKFNNKTWGLKDIEDVFLYCWKPFLTNKCAPRWFLKFVGLRWGGRYWILISFWSNWKCEFNIKHLYQMMTQRFKCLWNQKFVGTKHEKGTHKIKIREVCTHEMWQLRPSPMSTWNVLLTILSRTNHCCSYVFVALHNWCIIPKAKLRILKFPFQFHNL